MIMLLLSNQATCGHTIRIFHNGLCRHPDARFVLEQMSIPLNVDTHFPLALTSKRKPGYIVIYGLIWVCLSKAHCSFQSVVHVLSCPGPACVLSLGCERP